MKYFDKVSFALYAESLAPCLATHAALLYGITLIWNTTGDKTVINFPLMQFISLLRKLDISLQDTQTNRGQSVFSRTGFSGICTGCF